MHYVAHEITIWFWKDSHFENMTACFWGIKIHFDKISLNIDSSIAIALQTGLNQMIKQSFLRKAKNRNKFKVISLQYFFVKCFESTCLELLFLFSTAANTFSLSADMGSLICPEFLVVLYLILITFSYPEYKGLSTM